MIEEFEQLRVAVLRLWASMRPHLWQLRAVWIVVALLVLAYYAGTVVS